MPMMTMIIVAAAVVLCLVTICIIIYCRRKKAMSSAVKGSRLPEDADNTIEYDKGSSLDVTPVDAKTKGFN